MAQGLIARRAALAADTLIAIMEIWGVNDTMRAHAHEFAEAGFICLVPDLFWRQEPGVELGGAPYREVDAKRALALSLEFFEKYLG